jgi:Double zinc ribbon
MTERQIPCPRCQQENPPSHRFCGSCGAPLMSSEQLATRQEYRPVRAASALPSRLGSVGKAVAVGVAVLLAAEAGLSWLQHRIGTEDRSSLPAVRGVGSASRGYLVGQSLEEVLQMWEDSHGRVVARREVRSFVSTGPTGRRR